MSILICRHQKRAFGNAYKNRKSIHLICFRPSKAKIARLKYAKFIGKCPREATLHAKAKNMALNRHKFNRFKNK